MKITGIWPNLSTGGQPVELQKARKNEYCSCSGRNGACYVWKSIETGIVREIIHTCVDEREAISRTQEVIIDPLGKY